ncbi:MAG: hypothetical protein ACM3UZ_08700 [Acidobacteriota bacterium]
MPSITFYRIYETGTDEIDMALLEQKLAQDHSIARARFSRVKTKSIIMEIPPLLVSLAPYQSQNGRIEFTARAKIFDIGAVSITLRHEIITDAPIKHIEEIALQFGEQDGLDDVFSHYLRVLEATLSPHLGSLQINPAFYEDYTIVRVESRHQCPDPVTVLMSEPVSFSSQMRDEIMKNSLSYSEDDFAIISYDSALICDSEDPSDLMDLIEFANVQLLELRYYDDRLTRQMAKMYDDIESAHRMPGFRRIKQYHLIMSQLMKGYAEVTETTEKINNLIKITEDIYYAKIYETTLKVLRSHQWTESVARKINVILQNYTMLSNEVNVQHSNFLEWTIILLIALEFALAIWQSLR